LKEDKEIKYCICTEGSDIVFPYLRVMLLSLFKHNSWIKGDVIVLTCDLTPLSNHNKEILKSICPNIKYVNIEVGQYKYFNLKNSNRNTILTNLYRINAFSLTGFDFVMYISSLSFCISSITKLFVGDSDVLVANSGNNVPNREPGAPPRNKSIFNSSFMILSRDTLKMNLKDKILAKLKNTKNITNSDISNSIYDILRLNGNKVNHYDPNKIVRKSKYNDSKFSQFKAKKD